MMPGGWEWVIILLVALLVFGPRKLPEIGRTVGRLVRDLRRSSEELMAELKLHDLDVGEDLEEFARLPATLNRLRRWKG
jgi:sec-independent protein translocase protein TatA